MEIRLKYINQDSFYGSDYFIKRVDYEEKWDKTLDGNIKNMIKNRNYKTAVVGVNKETGDLLFLPITVENK